MIRFFRAAFIMVLTAFVVAGCASGPGMVGGGGLGTLFASAGQSRTAAVPVLDGAVNLAAPSGFCPDPSATRSSAQSAFVLYGSCHAINGRGAKPAAPAILTAAASPGAGDLGPDAMAALADYVQTDAGQAALSRTDSGTEVEIESLERTGDLILVRARDGAGQGAEQGVSPAFWRAIFPQSGTLVTVTVSNMATASVTAAQGKALAIDFVAAIRAANGPAPARDSEPETTTETVSDSDSDETGTNGLAAFFKRLL